MNRESVILTISNMNDIEKLRKFNIRYINIDIENVDKEVINYLIENGQNYLYAENINNINGYIYVDYETFLLGERIISNIISSVPENFNKLELAKYLYVVLGKTVGYDINTIFEKNETFNYNEINTINNIWGSLVNSKATNQSYCKLYLYLCCIFGIKCDIISVNDNGFLCNKLTIDNNNLIVDLTSDVPFIEAGFKTKKFASYNDNIILDKKIGYINNFYNDDQIDSCLKDYNHDDDNFVFEFLLNTQNVININNVKPIELGIVYDMLFSKYCPDVNININNLYINDGYNSKKHFILISYNGKYYSYNYKKKSFVKISEMDLINKLENNKIGIYLNENVPLKYECKEVV